MTPPERLNVSRLGSLFLLKAQLMLSSRERISYFVWACMIRQFVKMGLSCGTFAIQGQGITSVGLGSVGAGSDLQLNQVTDEMQGDGATMSKLPR